MKQSKYESPLGTMIIVGDDTYIYALFFEDQVHYYGHYNLGIIRTGVTRAIENVKLWLDQYFAGKSPNPEEVLLGEPEYQIERKVYQAISTIPYGQQWGYQQLLDAINLNYQSTSNLLNASKYFVQHNRLQILIPSHRVKDDNYPGKIARREALVNLENRN